MRVTLLNPVVHKVAAAVRARGATPLFSRRPSLPVARTLSRASPAAAAAASASPSPASPSNDPAATMSVTKACCTLPPVKHDYTPTGKKEEVVGLTTYLAGPEDAPGAILVIYDIFGFTPQAFQVCDTLAAATGFRVAMPDVLRGDAWGLDNFPPPDKDAFMKWIGSTASWDKIAQEDAPKFVEHLKQKGAKKLAIVGFCWGGKTALACANATKAFAAAASPHYSFVEPADLQAITYPVMLLPSGDEAPEGPLVDAINSTPYGDKSVVKRFPDMHHGWVAARGDWSVPLQAQRATEALQLMADFFKANLA